MKIPTDFIPFARPSIGREEEEAVLRVLRSGWLTTGNVTLEFEAAFARYVNAGAAIAVSSGTAGLHLALESTGVAAGEYVVTTPYTFAATAEIIRYVDAHPLFVDIEENTYNINPELVATAVKNCPGKPAALIPVHLGGLPCDMPRLLSIAGEAVMPVIEDCAHAFPVALDGRYAGLFGKIGVYSFYANKTITTGEGGMIVTDSPEAADRMRVMRTHGIDRQAWDRFTSPRNPWYYEIIDAGFKYNLTDIASAIGLVQLKRAEEFKKKRAAIAARYLEEFADSDFLIPPESHPQHAWHLFMVRIRPEKLSIDRNEFVRKLTERGIGISVHYTPLHVMPYYKKKYGYKPEDYPVALRNSLTSFSLPLYPDLQSDSVSRVIGTVKAIGDDCRPAHLRAPSRRPG